MHEKIKNYDIIKEELLENGTSKYRKAVPKYNFRDRLRMGEDEESNIRLRQYNGNFKS